MRFVIRLKFLRKIAKKKLLIHIKILQNQQQQQKISLLSLQKLTFPLFSFSLSSKIHNNSIRSLTAQIETINLFTSLNKAKHQQQS